MQWCISQENIKHSYKMLYIFILLILIIITTSVCVRPRSFSNLSGSDTIHNWRAWRQLLKTGDRLVRTLQRRAFWRIESGITYITLEGGNDEYFQQGKTRQRIKQTVFVFLFSTSNAQIPKAELSNLNNSFIILRSFLNVPLNTTLWHFP